ncbi:ACP phosphodiesterase [Vibrio sp. CK2-1]|uniref:acyl carrier protein phosphodiesterase n=1 Tax=Vibrio sp. CK2-1 TaxID=2912249 RepID=UPI001F008874|nr:ACP phosphodiesterase [Vibrio sp. CK2-1]MCF7354995.1 ACP phosphodiesterase [Vibrio sp. CK2-1]
MNFLAHLHIAEYCQSDLAGNLLGDFAKGNPEGKYPSHVVDGIRLHRFVDRYTDTHPLILQQKSLFDPQIKRFSPIALDMFWDHCLACEWSEFHHLSLSDFVEQCRSFCQSQTYEVPDNYRTTMSAMWRGEWLLSYQDINSTLYALERMSHRSPRMGPLNDCGDVLMANYEELRAVFLQFYPDVLNSSKRFIDKHQQP